MIWLTWRQFRVSALTLFGLLGAVAVALAVTGPRLHREGADLLAKCESPSMKTNAACTDGFDHFFFPHAGAYFGLILLVMAVPVVVGVFWGAPLISREFETGTQDLVWQQSVPRRRWLAVKLGLVGLAAIAAAGLAVVAVSWWSRPLDATAFDGVNRMTPILFDSRGYAVLGRAAFAFTLGAAVGLLIRRTVPAMAVTLVAFVAVQIVMPTWVRPQLATPVRLETAITANNLNNIGDPDPDGTLRGTQVDVLVPGAWVLTNDVVDSAGRTVDALPAWAADCATPDEPAGEVTQHQCLERLTAAGYRQVATYHPADRFWPFQAYETAIFGMLSLLLVGFCFLRILPR
jgi:hypothetical protein